jgi:hypothetical protein
MDAATLEAMYGPDAVALGQAVHAARLAREPAWCGSLTGAVATAADILDTHVVIPRDDVTVEWTRPEAGRTAGVILDTTAMGLLRQPGQAWQYRLCGPWTDDDEETPRG